MQHAEQILVCRVPSSLRPVFGPSAEQDRDALYSEAQVHQALLDYREQQSLAAPGGCIKLDRCPILPSLLHGYSYLSNHQACTGMHNKFAAQWQLLMT